jgi:hypothetical protein
MPFYTFVSKADLTLSCMEKIGWISSSGKAKLYFGLKSRIYIITPTIMPQEPA